MWNLLIKVEIFVDKVLIKMGQLFIFLFKLAVPQKIRDKYFNLEEKVENYIKSKKEKIHKRTEELYQKVKKEALEVKDEALKKIEEAKKIDWKTKALEYKLKLLTFVKTRTPKELLAVLLAYLAVPLIFLKKYFTGVSHKKIAIGVATSMVFGLASLHIYFESQKVVEKTSKVARQPAGGGDKDLDADGLPVRKNYYKQDKRQFQLTHVKIPVYYKDINELHTLTIDFSVQASNRYTKKYIDKFEHEVRDYMLMTVEPVLPEFPMEEEGKGIVKEKVLYELNEYLRQKDVEGYIEEVEIIYILGT
jgi:hypothetical protein